LHRLKARSTAKRSLVVRLSDKWNLGTELFLPLSTMLPYSANPVHRETSQATSVPQSACVFLRAPVTYKQADSAVRKHNHVNIHCSFHITAVVSTVGLTRAREREGR
jgi:hypothetical protein